MVGFLDLSKPGGQRIAESIAAAGRAGRQQATGAHGIVDMGAGDTVWTDAGGSHSVKEIPSQIDALDLRLAQACTDLDKAAADIVVVEDGLSTAQARADQAWRDAQTAIGNANTADGKATTALLSANGRNSRIVSTAAPNGTTNPQTGLALVKGDTWWRTDASGIGIDQWGWDGSAWTPQTIGSDVIANLDVLKLAVSGSARMATAVIDKVFGDAAHFGKLLVGGPSGVVSIADGAVTASHINATSELWAKVLAVAGDATIGGQLLVPGSVTAAQIDVLELFANAIAANAISTKGVTLGLDGLVITKDGAVVSRLSNSGEQLVTLPGVTIDDKGGVTGKAGAFETLRVAGQTIDDIIAPLPRGLIGQVPMIQAGPTQSGFTLLATLGLTLPGGRVYRISVPNLQMWVERQGGIAQASLVRAVDGAAPNFSTGVEVRRSYAPPVSADGRQVSIPPMEDYYDTLTSGPRRVDYGLYVKEMGRWCQVRHEPVGWATLSIEDVGNQRTESGTANYTSTSVRKEQFSKRYWPTTWGVYQRGGGRLTGVGSETPVQGYIAEAGINKESIFIFPDFLADLVGVEITRITIGAFANHWYWGSGGTGSWALHGQTGLGSTAGLGAVLAETPSWPRNADRFIDVPSTYFGGFKSGQYRGFGFTTANTDLLYYGKFNTDPSILIEGIKTY